MPQTTTRRVDAGRLRDLREERGYTQASLALAIGRHRSYIHRLESGVRVHPSPPVVAAIAGVLACSRDDFTQAN